MYSSLVPGVAYLHQGNVLVRRSLHWGRSEKFYNKFLCVEICLPGVGYTGDMSPVKPTLEKCAYRVPIGYTEELFFPVLAYAGEMCLTSEAYTE